MKKNICFYLFIFFLNFASFMTCVNGQVTPTRVEFQRLYMGLIPQKADNWCWAATAEMVMRYNNRATLTQCQIVQNWLTAMGYNFTCSCTCIVTGDCDQPISMPESLKKIFCSNGFQSKLFPAEKTEEEWSNLKSQIRTVKLPFAFIVQYNSEEEACVPSHALVGNGYIVYKQTIDGITYWTRYIFAHNPQSDSDCYGISNDKILYGTFPNTPDDEYTYCHFLTDIKKPCLDAAPMMLFSMDSARIKKSLIDTSVIQNPSTTIQGELNGFIVKSTLSNYISPESNYTVIPIRYLDMSKMLTTPAEKLETQSVIYNLSPILELVHDKKVKGFQTVNRIQLVDNKWLVKNVSQSANPILIRNDSLSNKFDNKKVKWQTQVNKIYSNNNIMFDLPVNGYEKIKFPPFHYEFFHFTNNGVHYYKPVSDYKDVYGKNFFKLDTYRENEVLKILQKKAQEYKDKLKK